ncbi:MAG: HD-GYP domain-containing protein [Chloroflexi bacterium]|nr:HD-GYP domain-containing protein [Chloroflexota bacterium]
MERRDGERQSGTAGPATSGPARQRPNPSHYEPFGTYRGSKRSARLHLLWWQRLTSGAEDAGRAAADLTRRLATADLRQRAIADRYAELHVDPSPADRPVRPAESSALLISHRETLVAAEQLDDVFRDERQQNPRLGQAFVETARLMVAALSARDPYTGGHSSRVAGAACALARELDWGQREIDDLEVGALLHDAGKIGVSDAILRKRGPLDEEEWREMRRHPEIGAGLLSRTVTLRPAHPTALHHHERLDGAGYPRGLRGDEIPLAARVVAIADAFDAMVSTRSYRTALPLEFALAELEQHAGSQFDPAIVPAFVASVRAGRITC